MLLILVKMKYQTNILFLDSSNPPKLIPLFAAYIRINDELLSKMYGDILWQ